MSKIRIICPHCGAALQGEESDNGHKLKCPHCRHSFRARRPAPPRFAPEKRRRGKRKLLWAGVALAVAALVVAGIWIFAPPRMNWPDRRPIGVLFLASDAHASVINPRGWFNDEHLDVTGADGAAQFHKALMDYTDRSLEILKRTGAQGVMVWDLEGEQFPHKTTFIGDPRLLGKLAPEMDAVADEFFARLRHAGLRVGLTIRPQQLVFDHGQPRQTPVLNIKQVLLEKIDYARKRWGVTLFYLDHNGSFWRPDEIWQLRSLMKARPDILLLPEHHYLPYWAFSAPYVALRKGNSAVTANWARRLFPASFQILDIGDTDSGGTAIAEAWRAGDILLFRAWFWSSECQFVEDFTRKTTAANPPP